MHGAVFAVWWNYSIIFLFGISCSCATMIEVGLYVDASRLIEV